MRIAFIGSGDVAVPALTALNDSSHEIACVITQPDRPGGRGRKLTPTPVKRAASDLHLPVWSVPNINEPTGVERLRSQRAAVGVVIAFGQKIGPDLLAALPGGCINLHPSLLPRYRGAAPVPWAIIRGESKTGVTVFKLVERMDAGPILTTIETPIGPTETAAELTARLADLGPAAVLNALELFADGSLPQGTPQDHAQATTAPKFRKQDGRIAFDRPAHQLVQLINGLWSWPGAACRYQPADQSRNEPVTLARARTATHTPPDAAPGVITHDLTVSALHDAVEILEIKPQSGKLMSWSAFVNGRHVRPGDRFLPLDLPSS